MSIEKLDFQKVTKELTSYTVLLNSVIQHIDNAEALGVYVYLYSLPPDWCINKEQLMKKFDLGDKKLRQIMMYFSRANLARYVKERDPKTGHVLGTSIHLLNGEKFDPTVTFRNVPTTEAAETAASDSTEAAITEAAENRHVGLEGLQKKHSYKRKKDTKERGSLSDFSPDRKAWELCEQKRLDPQLVLDKFKAHHIARGTEERIKDFNAEFYKWILNERSN